MTHSHSWLNTLELVFNCHLSLVSIENPMTRILKRQANALMAGLKKKPRRHPHSAVFLTPGKTRNLLRELKTNLYIANGLGFIQRGQWQTLNRQIDRVSRQIGSGS